MMMTMRSNFKIVLIKIFLLPFIFIIVHYCYNYERIQADGLDSEIFVFLYKEEETEYSVDYSHRKFNNIEIGMSEKEALEIVGEPISKYSKNKYGHATDTLSNEVTFLYSIPKNGGHYRQRQLSLKDDKVVVIGKSFYYD